MRLRTVAAIAAVLAVGACSDSQSPATPGETTEEVRVQLDESAADVDAGVMAGAAELGTAGRGKTEKLTADPQTVFCFDKGLHEFCFDLRNSRVRRATSDAIVTKAVSNTRGEIRLNGRLLVWTNNIGRQFVGDVIGARYPRLNIRVFPGDKICHKWKGNPVPQVCARFF